MAEPQQKKQRASPSDEGDSKVTLQAVGTTKGEMLLSTQQHDPTRWVALFREAVKAPFKPRYRYLHGLRRAIMRQTQTCCQALEYLAQGALVKLDPELALRSAINAQYYDDNHRTAADAKRCAVWLSVWPCAVQRAHTPKQLGQLRHDHHR